MSRAARLIHPVFASVTAILTSDGGHSTAGQDCTAAGYADYLGIAVFATADQRKNGVNRIGSPALVASATRNVSGSAVPVDATYTGTDGNPTTNWTIASSGIWVVTALATDRVSVTVPLPDTNSHTIKVACGAWNNVGTMTATARASLSGGGAGPTADVISAAVETFKEYTYTVRANGGGQSFVFTIEATSTSTVAADAWLLLNRITYL